MRKIITSLLLFIPFVLFSSNDSTKTKKTQIGVSVSPDYCFRKLKSDASSQWIADIRDTLEIPKIGFTGGINFNYQFNKKFSLETGLLFSDKGEKTKKYSLGNTASTKDPIKNTFIYHYYYLCIPVKANYYVLTGKLKLYVTAGISANIFLTQQTTSIAEYSYKDSEKIKSFNNSGFSKLNLMLLGGLGMKYAANEKFDINIEPLYSRSMISITNAPVKSYLYGIGINLGIYYKI